VQYLLQSQSPQGGWRYAPNSDSDVSVTAWIVTALVTARLADIDVPQSHFDRVMRYLDGVASHGGSRYPYQAGREPTLSMTAAAILCRQYIGWPRDDRRIVAALDWLTETENLVNYDGKRNVYYWYYATYACHHMGGSYWEQWNEAMRKAVLQAQVKRGREAGSWDPSETDPFETRGGRLYTTCLSIYMLQVYYRYVSICAATAKGDTGRSHRLDGVKKTIQRTTDIDNRPARPASDFERLKRDNPELFPER
jgi:hypothetical protein